MISTGSFAFKNTIGLNFGDIAKFILCGVLIATTIASITATTTASKP